MPDTITASHTIAIEDVEYQKGMLARLYRPSGAGPFPAALQVHGGACRKRQECRDRRNEYSQSVSQQVTRAAKVHQTSFQAYSKRWE